MRDRDHDTRELRLSDRQVGEVLERASRIEARGGDGGLTLSELQDIAHQVGIPPEALSRAVSAVVRTAGADRTGPRAWLHHREVTFVEGAVSDDDLAWLVRVLDQLGRIQGRVRHDRGVLRWRSPDGFRTEVVNRPLETHVTVEALDHYAASRAAVGFMTVGLFAGVVGVDAVDAIYPLVAGGVAGAASFGVWWKIRAERLRNAVGRTSRGVSEVLRMVAGRRRDTDA